MPRPNDRTNPLAVDFMKVMAEGGEPEKRAGRTINREAVVTGMESLGGGRDMGDFIVTYGPNKVRRGNQNNIELQVVAKGGGFAYQLRPDPFDLSS